MSIQAHLILAAVLIQLCRACMDLGAHFGTLSSTSEMMTNPLASPSSSCSCCALCHRNDGCKSFSFDMTNNECKLYNKVGSYADFSRQRQTEHTKQFFFMPSSSQTNEFCRTNSDCLVDGDTCRARSCTSATSATSATCRDLYQLNSALPDHRYWALIDGRERLIYCRMEGGFEGATLLLAFQHPITVPWNYDNLLDRPHGYPDETSEYSILKHADLIRDRGTMPQYRVWILVTAHGGYPAFQQNFTADRDLSLIGYERILISTGRFTAVPEVMYDERYLVFPHITSNCAALYSTGNYECNNRRSVVKEADMPWWPTGTQARTRILIYITE